MDLTADLFLSTFPRTTLLRTILKDYMKIDNCGDDDLAPFQVSFLPCLLERFDMII